MEADFGVMSATKHLTKRKVDDTRMNNNDRANEAIAWTLRFAVAFWIVLTIYTYLTQG